MLGINPFNSTSMVVGKMLGVWGAQGNSRGPWKYPSIVYQLCLSVEIEYMTGAAGVGKFSHGKIPVIGYSMVESLVPIMW